MAHIGGFFEFVVVFGRRGRRTAVDEGGEAISHQNVDRDLYTGVRPGVKILE